MRDFKKFPQAATVGAAPGMPDPAMPYSLLTSSGDGFAVADLPYDDGGHGSALTSVPVLVRAGRT